jgi:protoporphyrinogen IX oxidase
MLWIKSFHIIAMVAWFAALFYLPRLYVYHSQAKDQISIDRFKVMERRLYQGIMTPAALITTLLGLWLLIRYFPFYQQMVWMQLKLLLVILLWAYHLICGRFNKIFARDENRYSQRFFRWFNEIPTLLLVGIVILVEVKPFQ